MAIHQQRRRFNGQERAALYLASGGKCAVCGTPLPHGWHADHKRAYARGGVTDVVNGQALCPTCNLKKGSKGKSMVDTAAARQWQTEAWDVYFANNQRDFLCCACPGAGKTHWTLRLARRLLDVGAIDRVVIVAPSRPVRDQWANQHLVHLEAVKNADGGRENPKDFEGCTLTYAQVTMNPALQRAACHDRRTLVVFDEIHHAGEQQSWGDTLVFAFEYAERRLGLTGTPWRAPKKGRIPFATYDEDGRILIDFNYSYGRAVVDRTCRAIQYHAYDAEVRCVELELGTSTTVSLSDLSDTQDKSKAMDTILDPKKDWLRAMLDKGIRELAKIRAGSTDDGAVPDAQGLVIADDQEHARALTEMLAKMTGETPELIISDEADAEDALTRFRGHSRQWAVAVNKVSEGVDVQQLYVGVYATRKTSPLLFRQISGRFVRRRGESETRDAVLFIPAVPDLLKLSSEIEQELRHAVELALDEDETERKQRDRPREPGEPDLKAWDAGDPRFADVIRSGETYSSVEYQAAAALAQRKPETAHLDPVLIAQLFRQNGTPLGVAQTATPSTPPTTSTPLSRWQQKVELRKLLDKRAKALAYKAGIEAKSVNQKIAEMFGPRSSLSIDELKKALEWVEVTYQRYEQIEWDV